MVRWWRFGRAQCAECEGMFTINKGINYRGDAKDENMICDSCNGTVNNQKRYEWTPR